MRLARSILAGGCYGQLALANMRRTQDRPTDVAERLCNQPLVDSVVEGLACMGLCQSVHSAMGRALIATFCLEAGVRPSCQGKP